MTQKQEKILSTALELFANEGFDATSTSKIAEKAGVSEGLIFRHFKNKKGLLEAIMRNSEQKLRETFHHIITEENPSKVLQYTIELPFQVKQKDFNYWRLQFKLKLDKEYNNPKKMQPFLDKLTQAFKYLHYPDPYYEATLLLQIVDSISIEILKANIKDLDSYKSFLLKKYGL